MNTDELIKKNYKLSGKIENIGVGSIHGFGPKYTGIWNELGISTQYNSPMCSDQIKIAMLLSGHPLVDQLLESDLKRSWDFDPEPLRKAQILKGTKILDLGCGYVPTFVRCARRLGAHAYTVDVIPADQFESTETYFSEEDKKIESENHIQLDLNRKDALDIILQKTQGEFDMITEAHLRSGGIYKGEAFYFFSGEEFSLPLLKKEGVYFLASGVSSEVIQKEESIFFLIT